MFRLIKSIFRPSAEKDIKKYSVTTTSAKEGSNCRSDLNPIVKNILENIKSSNNVSIDDINKINEFYFNKPKLEPGIYTLNKELTDKMIFEINRIDIINLNNDINDVYIILSEITLGDNVSIVVSIKDFHEIFSKFKIPSNQKGDD